MTSSVKTLPRGFPFMVNQILEMEGQICLAYALLGDFDLNELKKSSLYKTLGGNTVEVARYLAYIIIDAPNDVNILKKMYDFNKKLLKRRPNDKFVISKIKVLPQLIQLIERISTSNPEHYEEHDEEHDEEHNEGHHKEHDEEHDEEHDFHDEK